MERNRSTTAQRPPECVLQALALCACESGASSADGGEPPEGRGEIQAAPAGSGSDASQGASGDTGGATMDREVGSGEGALDAGVDGTSSGDAAMSCPSGYRCTSVPGNVLSCARIGGTFPDQTCSSDGDCPLLPSSRCQQLGQGGACVTPCTPVSE